MSKNLISVLFVDAGISFGGSLIVVARLANQLDKKIYKPIVVTATPVDKVKHHFEDGVKLIELGRRLNYKDRMNYSAKIKKYPYLIKKISLYIYTIVEFILNLEYFFELKNLAKKYDVQIIHANNSLEPIKVASSLNIKCVWHFHGNITSNPSSLRHLLKKCDHYISISQFVTDSVIQYNIIDINKLTTLLNPLQPNVPAYTKNELKEFKIKLGLNPSTTVVGVFGRLVAWKGQKEYLKAFKKISRNLDIVTLFIGDDSEFEGYKKDLLDYRAESMFRDVVASENSVAVELFGRDIVETWFAALARDMNPGWSSTSQKIWSCFILEIWGRRVAV